MNELVISSFSQNFARFILSVFVFVAIYIFCCGMFLLSVNGSAYNALLHKVKKNAANMRVASNAHSQAENMPLKDSWWGDGLSRLTFNSKTLIEIHPAYPAFFAGRGGNVLSADDARTFTLSLCEAFSPDDQQKKWIIIRKNSTSTPLMYSYHSSSL